LHRRGKEKAAKKNARKAETLPESDEESDGYGEDGLSWEAVLATVQGGSAQGEEEQDE